MEEKLSQKTAQHPFKYRSVSASSVTEQKQPLTSNKTLPLANRQLSVEEENVLKNFSIPNSMKWKLFFALPAFSCALHRSPANKAKCSENSTKGQKSKLSAAAVSHLSTQQYHPVWVKHCFHQDYCSSTSKSSHANCDILQTDPTLVLLRSTLSTEKSKIQTYNQTLVSLTFCCSDFLCVCKWKTTIIQALFTN